MNDLFNSLPFRPADILLPKDCEYSKWSVVACDQYTSQPEYWQRVEEYVGRAPSALRLILPESCLEGPNVETDIVEVNNTMTRYLREGCFRELPESLIYVERRLSNGRLRRGLVGKVDLEQYDYEPGAASLVRATEGTVLSRIPPPGGGAQERPSGAAPRDAPGRRSGEDGDRAPLPGARSRWRRSTTSTSWSGAAMIAGWKLDGESMTLAASALRALADPAAFNAKYGTVDKPVLLFAVGDGNHSLATAKECYERQKKLTPPGALGRSARPVRPVRAGEPPRRLPGVRAHPPGGVRRGAGGGGGGPAERLSRRLCRRGGSGHVLRWYAQDKRAPSPCPAPTPSWRWHPPARAGCLCEGPRRAHRLHPRLGRGPGTGRPPGQHRLPPARHGQGAALPHRDPRRSPPPQDLLHGGRPTDKRFYLEARKIR